MTLKCENLECYQAAVYWAQWWSTTRRMALCPLHARSLWREPRLNIWPIVEEKRT